MWAAFAECDTSAGRMVYLPAGRRSTAPKIGAGCIGTTTCLETTRLNLGPINNPIPDKTPGPGNYVSNLGLDDV